MSRHVWVFQLEVFPMWFFPDPHKIFLLFTEILTRKVGFHMFFTSFICEKRLKSYIKIEGNCPRHFWNLGHKNAILRAKMHFFSFWPVLMYAANQFLLSNYIFDNSFFCESNILDLFEPYHSYG